MKQDTEDKYNIAVNRKAHHEFFIEERFEAGIALEGWEVKSLRAGRVQLDQGYILLKNGRGVAVWCPDYPIANRIHPYPSRSATQQKIIIASP